MPAFSRLDNLLKHGEWLLLGQQSNEATALADSILAVDRENSRALHLAGLAAVMDGDFPSAVKYLTRAVDLGEGRATWFADLAIALFAAGSLEEAEERSLRALALDANCAVAHDLLAEIAARQGQDHRACNHIRTLASLRPDDFKTRSRLAIAEYAVGNVPEAIRQMRELIAKGKASRHLHATFLSALLYDPGQTRESLRQEFQQWAALCQTRAPRPISATRRCSARKLRLGYLSGEFLVLPARHFLLPIFRHHDRERFEITCYHARNREDAQTVQYRMLVDHWCHCSSMDDEELVKQIEADEIDILVDLSGHFNCNRLTVFAQRPAPVQVTYPNHPSTTGILGIRYILTDRWVCPSGAESQYTEEAYLLPSGYLAYEPPAEAPNITQLPSDRTDMVVFGFFQRPAKWNTAVWDTVAKVLAACPDSKLLVHHASTELDDPNSAICRRVQQEVTVRGIAPDRIIYRGKLSVAEHLELVAEAHIGLDTFPYNGTTTTCECLWMGVPVVTLAGDLHASRVGYEVLDRTGLKNLVAVTTEEYVQIAVALAHNRDRLRKLRYGLRSQVRQSALLNSRALVHEMEAAYVAMWQLFLKEHQ